MSFVDQIEAWRAKRKAFESDRVADQRRAICETCEFNLLNFCKKCGCALALKILVMESRCPDQPPRW